MSPYDRIGSDKRLGVEQEIGGRWFLRTRVGASGHALYGPYTKTCAGNYEVEFDLALLEVGEGGDDDPVCAVVDVTASSGDACVARREIRASELAPEPRAFVLPFTLRGYRTVEHRVTVTGHAALLVWAGTRRSKLPGVPGEEPPSDPRADTSDPVELARKVRAVLRLLRPQAAVGYGKVRLGNLGDGGYVHLDDFRGLDTALSLGINDDISWDLDAAARGMTVYQFDHTVDDPAPGDARMVFERKRIGPVSDADAQGLADLVRRHDKGARRPNLLLKMDLECQEWDVFNATDPALLARFAQIVCELHYLQGLDRADWRRRICDALDRLHERYAVVHVHANTVGGTSMPGNVFVPNVLEVTFANRRLYRFRDTDELFPGPLDYSCDADHPDTYLGSFRY